MKHFSKKSLIDARTKLIFGWHEHSDALEKLDSPWQKVRVIEPSADIVKSGTRVVFEIKRGSFPVERMALHTAYKPGGMFRDEQVSGPFKSWVDTHRVESYGDNGCLLIDEIVYELPFGFLGRIAGGWFVGGQLERLFEYRRSVTRQACDTRKAVTRKRSGNLHVFEKARRRGRG